MCFRYHGPRARLEPTHHVRRNHADTGALEQDETIRSSKPQALFSTDTQGTKTKRCSPRQPRRARTSERRYRRRARRDKRVQSPRFAGPRSPQSLARATPTLAGPSAYRFFALATTFFAAFFTAAAALFTALFFGGLAPLGNTITRLPSNATTIWAILSTPALRNSAA